jgi:uncharacterized protein (TIGR01777 family)
MSLEDTARLTVAVSGASGFVGSRLVADFQKRGWKTIPLGRNDFKLASAELAKRLLPADIIVNLAGAPIIARWTEEYKRTMYASRVEVTRKIVDACSLLETKPRLLISTSAIGYYSNQGQHTEQNYVKADGFLGSLAQAWEDAALEAGEIGMRVVIFRFGVVIGRDGGALKKMLIPFKAGLGGTIGDGSQPFSWVHIHDLIRAYVKVIHDTTCEGVYNLTAPKPTTNKGLTQALSAALRKPAFLQVPRFVLRLQFGEGAQVLIQGQNVLPKRLLDSGFQFTFSDIDAAVKDCVVPGTEPTAVF